MNIAQIAKMAGVSSAAVSRYFNNGYISEEKREAIRKVVEETGYKPSMQAQTLRTKKTKMIGVIAPKLASSSLGSVVEGILSVLNRNGYQMLLAVTQNNSQKELEYLESFDNKQVDGVILVATVFTAEHKKALKNLSVPVVVIGQKFSGYCCVYHDDYHAMYELTKMALEKGHTKLGYLAVMLQDKAAGADRYKGYCDAVRDMGYQELADNYSVAQFTVQSGYEKAQGLMEKHTDLDGLICATDEIAVGAIEYLKDHHTSKLESFMIAGTGDSQLAKVAGHPMATVHYSYEKSGEIAVEMLLEMLHGGKAVLQEIMLGYYIVEN